VERRRSLIALCALVTATRIWAGPSEDGVKANDEEIAPPAAAATKVVAYQGGRFLLRRAPYGECVVALQGAVTRDAAPRFDDIVKEADTLLCNKPLLLLLESRGGLVLDAIGLGERVRAQGLRTVVRYGCASACSLIFLGGSTTQTLPVAMYTYVGGLVSAWNKIFAVVIVSMIPILLFYMFAQKKFIQGFAGGLKG